MRNSNSKDFYKFKWKSYFYLMLYSLIFFSCNTEDETMEYEPISISIPQPENFPEIQYESPNNELSEAGFELGKKLFFEGDLSKDGTISCGFCHEQAFAFTHHGHTVSHGIEGLEGFRNSQPIQNLAYMQEFGWDGASSHLDFQPIIPITSEFEMGETLSSVSEKLSSQNEYKRMFQNAFGDDEINGERILKSLAQFMTQMVSSNSKYDKYVRGEDGVTLSEIETKGLNIFNQKCSSCHATDLFTDQSYRNNGLAVRSRFPNEKGRQRVTGNESDFYKFKVPSLRNVEKTFPYMHDGRFRTIKRVLDFYDEGMVDNGNVDESLKREDGTFGITLSEEEKYQLEAFLLTLTDNEFLNDDRFSEF